MTDDKHRITDVQTLTTLYGNPGPTSLRKEIDYLHPYYQAFIKASPFMVLATGNAQGLDTSPRGDPAGFVTIEDDKTLLIPDRRGNNRIDSLRNIVADPRVALLFLIPGIGEALRVNGQAHISVDPALLGRFEVDGKKPRSVIVLAVERVFFQCSRAIMRSELWNPERHIARDTLPSTGTILQTLSKSEIDGVEYDAVLVERQKATLY